MNFGEALHLLLAKPSEPAAVVTIHTPAAASTAHRRAGCCARCGGAFEREDAIVYRPGVGAVHEGCGGLAA